MHQIRSEQKADKVVGEVRSWVEQGNKPNYKDIRGKEEYLKTYAQIFEALEIKDDTLYYPILLNNANQEKNISGHYAGVCS